MLLRKISFLVRAGVIVAFLLPSFSFADQALFPRTLRRGMSGADVVKLQELLKAAPTGGQDVYPEGITSGYFGALTEQAVKRFQTKYGFETVGIAGPKTRAKLQELSLGNGAQPVSYAAPASTQQPKNCPTPTATGCTGIKRSSFDPSAGKCVGSGAVEFGASPFKLDQIALIEPMGLTVGGHVTPIDHGYVFGIGTPDVPFDSFDIQSPAKGYVVEVSRTNRGTFSDYALTIEFSCTHYVHYSNMSSFAPRLMEAAGGAVGENEMKTIRLPVAEGELVGKTGPYGIDLSVWDLDKTLTGFVNPKSYSEHWKLHSAQLYDYMKEPLKSQLLAKTPRQAEPRFGKIDYDIDGRLVGNWFEVGTGGYAGLNQGHEGYWSGHLSVAYDALDPTGIVVSVGNWNGEAKQFGVRGNTPDPKNVDVGTGMVKYELLQIDWIDPATGEHWDHRRAIPKAIFKPIDGVPNAVKGVILLQLSAPGTLKVETFPNKTAAEVTGFTPAARVYER